MASSNESYWSRSWALLTREKGWFKPLLVLSAVQLVPIVGSFGANGYALEWARLTAWGVDSSPKQKGVDISGCIKSGARAFVVALGYILVLGVISSVLQGILGAVFGGLLSAVITAVSAVLLAVVTLRATIYQSIGAGYEVSRVADMIKRDYEGLLRIVGMVLVLNLGLGLIASVLFGGAMLTQSGTIIRDVMSLEGNSYVDDIDIVFMVLRWFAGALPALFVVGYLVGIVGSGVSLITHTAVGYWMRQFDVPRWGASSDPLPETGGRGPAVGYGQPATGTPYGQQPTGTAYDQTAGQAAEASAQSAMPYEVPTAYDVPQTMDQMSQVPQQPISEAAHEVPPMTPDMPAPAAGIAWPEPVDAPPAADAPATFTLDDMAPSPAAPVETAAPAAFTLDDAAPAEQPAETAAPAPFTLDDMTPKPAAPVEETPAPAPFTLDDYQPVAAAPEAAPVETFSLDDVAPATAAPATFSLDDAAPATEAPATFTLDDEAPQTTAPATFTLDDAIAQTRAFVDTDLTEPVVVAGPAVPLPPQEAAEAAPVAPAANEGEVPTFSLDNLAPAEEPEAEVVVEPEPEVEDVPPLNRPVVDDHVTAVVPLTGEPEEAPQDDNQAEE